MPLFGIEPLMVRKETSGEREIGKDQQKTSGQNNDTTSELIELPRCTKHAVEIMTQITTVATSNYQHYFNIQHFVFP